MGKIRQKILNENNLKDEFSYFSTQHTAGLKSTEELISKCHIKNGSFVLDVGCGIGTTACLLAKKYNCKVVGVDINKKMIEFSKKRAKKTGVTDKVKFIVADAQNLPFKNDFFDVVIAESVNAFVNDKQKAINEYARVTKPGGYVGLNEATWIKTPPPQEIIEFFSQLHVKLSKAGLKAYNNWLNEYDMDGWVTLLKNAGLKNIYAKAHKSTPQKISYFIKNVGFTNIIRVCILYLISSKFRSWMDDSRMPKEVFEYYGYGIYVGRKLV